MLTSSASFSVQYENRQGNLRYLVQDEISLKGILRCFHLTLICPFKIDLRTFATELWHGVLEAWDNVSVNLCHPRPFDEVVEFPSGRVLWQVLEVVEKRLQFSLKQPSVQVVLQLLVPERAHIHLQDNHNCCHLPQASIGITRKHLLRSKNYSSILFF